MIIHSYFTDGFFKWGKFYLETLRYHNNLNYPVVLNTVGLTDDQIRELKGCYPGNVTILNEPLDMRKFSNRAGISVKLIDKYKHECENIFVTPTNKVWKLMTAGEDRVKALRNVIHQYHLHDNYILHTDVDTYFRAPLQPLLKQISHFDITLRFRPKINPVKARMSIGVMGIRMNLKVFAFMEEWVRQIEKVPAQHRPIGYGQISCWEAFKATRHDNLIWGDLPKAYGTHGKIKNSQKLWAGNLHNISKENTLALFKTDFEKFKTQGG